MHGPSSQPSEARWRMTEEQISKAVDFWTGILGITSCYALSKEERRDPNNKEKSALELLLSEIIQSEVKPISIEIRKKFKESLHAMLKNATVLGGNYYLGVDYAPEDRLSWAVQDAGIMPDVYNFCNLFPPKTSMHIWKDGKVEIFLGGENIVL